MAAAALHGVCSGSEILLQLSNCTCGNKYFQLRVSILNWIIRNDQSEHVETQAMSLLKYNLRLIGECRELTGLLLLVCCDLFRLLNN